MLSKFLTSSHREKSKRLISLRFFICIVLITSVLIIVDDDVVRIIWNPNDSVIFSPVGKTCCKTKFELKV